MSTTTFDYSHLDTLKQRLEQLRPLPASVISNLHEDLVLRWTYHSNAIEGNTLTLKETRVVLEGITVGGKTLREHLEVLNHREAIQYVEAIVQQPESCSEWQVKNIHRLVLKHLDDDNAGRYRTVNVTIAGARHTPPSFLQVSTQMQALMNWYQQQATSLHPVERAARLHIDLVKIHPFVDGNGRTARLIMNLELLKHGFPAVVLSVATRLAYYEALDIAHLEGDYSAFLELLITAVEDSFQPYWFALGIERL
jgi:Fic family protein